MIRKDIKEFLNTLPKDVTLVAATKYGDSGDLRELYSNSVTNFGENRVDAFLNKYESLKDLLFHFFKVECRLSAKKDREKIPLGRTLCVIRRFRRPSPSRPFSGGCRTPFRAIGRTPILSSKSAFGAKTATIACPDRGFAPDRG